MSALEQEILEQILRLDETSRRRIVEAAAATLRDKVETSPDWLEEIRTIRAEMRAKYGKSQFSVATLLNEVREERLNDLMDRYCRLAYTSLQGN